MSSSKHNKDKLPFGADKSGLHLVRKKSKGKGDKGKDDKGKGDKDNGDKDKERRKSASKGLGISNTLAAAMLHAVGGKGSGQYYVEKVKQNEESKSSGSRRGSSLSESFDRLSFDDGHDRHHDRRRDPDGSSPHHLLYDEPSSAQSYDSQEDLYYYHDEPQPSVQSSGHSSRQSSGWKDDETDTTGTSTLYDRKHGEPPRHQESTKSSQHTVHPPPRRDSRHQHEQDRFYDPAANTQTKSSASTIRPPGRKTTGFRDPSPDRSSSKAHGHKGSRTSSHHSSDPSADPKKTTPLQRGPKAEVIEADDRSSLAASSKGSTAAEFTLPPVGKSRRHSGTGHGGSREHENPHRGHGAGSKQKQPETPHRRTSSSRKQQPEPPLQRGPKAEVTEADDRESLAASSKGSTAAEFTLPPLSKSRQSSTGGASSSRRHSSSTWLYPEDSRERDRHHRPPATGYYPPPSTNADSRDSRDTRESGYYPHPPSSSIYSDSTSARETTTTDSTNPARPNPFDFQIPGYGPGYEDHPGEEYYGPLPQRKSYIPGRSSTTTTATESTVTTSSSAAYGSDSDDTVRGPDRGGRASVRRSDRRTSRFGEAKGKDIYEDFTRQNLYRE